MYERAVLVVCLVTALLSGAAVLGNGANGFGWLDALFLTSTGVCVVLGLHFLWRRLRRLSHEVDNHLKHTNK